MNEQTERIPFWQREEATIARGERIEVKWFPQQQILSIGNLVRSNGEEGGFYWRRTIIHPRELHNNLALRQLLVEAFAAWGLVQKAPSGDE